jgi:cellulose synthase/poly-beta-1,6-N-acetylglucosamine synthase-like glycosyltransferase
LTAASVLSGLLAAAAVLGALFWTVAGLHLLSVARRFPRLPDIPPDLPASAVSGWPRVSVVVPARNEEGSVEAAARALLALDYPALEVVAVDDRSTDATGHILDRLAASDLQLRVRHVNDLPAGWLGKNHAMAEGAASATGEWLLFTDADVHFSPDALKRSMAFALRHGLGHCVAFPHFMAPGFLERAFVTTFAVFLNLDFRVWDLERPGTSAFVGMGAFNLVKRSAYEAVGSHARLAFEVVDDVKLGLVLRRSGVPQGACDSGGLVKVRWQAGFRASLRGLVKNAFAGAEWSLATAAVSAVSIALLSAAPLAALLLLPSWPLRFVGLLGTLAPAVIHGATAKRAAQGTGLEGLVFPLCGVLLAGVLMWSAVLALARQGIFWRGTFYRLDDLRRGCLRRRDWPVSGAVGWPIP